MQVKAITAKLQSRYLEKGKLIFNFRWWWRITENPDDECQCVWTQLKNQNILD